MKKITYFGYTFSPHSWVETQTQYGQYDIFISETKSIHSGYQISKGKKIIGQAKGIAACKKMVRDHRKYNSKKCLRRIEYLKSLELKCYQKALKLEKNSSTKAQVMAQKLYDKSRKLSHQAFNLEMGRPENSKY